MTGNSGSNKGGVGGINMSYNSGSGVNETVDYEVQPRTFTELLRGGCSNNLIVDGVVYQNGRRWSNGKVWLPVGFNQRF